MNKLKKEIIIISIIFLISLMLFFTLLVIVGRSGGELKIDNNIMEFIYNHRGNKKSFNRYLNLFNTELGGIFFTTLIMIITLIYTKFDRGYLCLFIGVFLCIILHMAIKDVYERERPLLEMRWTKEDSYSFPSGHSTNSTFVYGFITYYLFKKNYNNKIKYISLTLSIILPTLVMLSRMVLGVHYFTDVLAGMSLGLIIMSFMIVLYNVLEYNDLLNEPLIRFKKKEKLNEKEDNN